MKTLVIGLDAATMDLIEPWAAAGRLPSLARLMSEGASGRLMSTPNMHSASAWTSILTGLNPGRHGLFVFSDRDFETGKQVFFKGGDRVGQLISSHLARHRLTSGFLNVPMTYPAACGPESFMVSGLDAPSLNDRAFCPSELRDELFRRFPDYAFTPRRLGELMRAGRLDEVTGEWLKLIETQTSAAEYLIETRETDFFMTVYTASDWGGHNLWTFNSSAEVGDTRDHPLLEIYRALDKAIARLLARAESETNVFVLSDHGMGRHTGASYHLADWLEANGFMVRNRSSQARASIVDSSRRVLKGLLPDSARERVKASIGEARLERLRAANKDSFYSSIDWTRTFAYTEPGRHVININLEGRNPNGIVARSDYDQICAQVIQALSQWIDREGNRFVQRAARRDELYSGPFAERASDLYVYWNPEANAGEPPGEVRARGFWWNGDHRPEGVLICKGPGIPSKAVLASSAVYDLVPTMMYAAGLPLPDGLDGSLIRSAFTDEFLAANPERIDQTGSPGAENQLALSADEEQLVEEKLRGLGYL